MKNERTNYLPLRRSVDLTTQQLADETLIYDLQTDKAYCLNYSSAIIWDACDGRKTIAEISGELTGKLNSPLTEDFIYLALENLHKAGLLANGEQLTGNFAGVSRREVIKRIGLTTAVALPMVSALLVPTAAEASSRCLATGATGETCPPNPSTRYPYAPCCSGTCQYVAPYRNYTCS